MGRSGKWFSQGGRSGQEKLEPSFVSVSCSNVPCKMTELAFPALQSWRKPGLQTQGHPAVTAMCESLVVPGITKWAPHRWQVLRAVTWTCDMEGDREWNMRRKPRYRCLAWWQLWLCMCTDPRKSRKDRHVCFFLSASSQPTLILVWRWCVKFMVYVRADCHLPAFIIIDQWIMFSLSYSSPLPCPHPPHHRCELM